MLLLFLDHSCMLQYSPSSHSIITTDRWSEQHWLPPYSGTCQTGAYINWLGLKKEKWAPVRMSNFDKVQDNRVRASSNLWVFRVFSGLDPPKGRTTNECSWTREALSACVVRSHGTAAVASVAEKRSCWSWYFCAPARLHVESHGQRLIRGNLILI